MNQIYDPCPCNSGEKLKFCCLKKRPDEILKDASKFPIYECLIADTKWEKNGLAVFSISRSISENRYACAFYLVDTYCLGVKDTFAKAPVDRAKMLEIRNSIGKNYSLRPYEYENARSMILGAIDYAATLGFEPNYDWRESRFIIEADRDYVKKFTFGLDGKPFYIQGPNDDASSVMAKLAAIDYNYLVKA